MNSLGLFLNQFNLCTVPNGVIRQVRLNEEKRNEIQLEIINVKHAVMEPFICHKQ